MKMIPINVKLEDFYIGQYPVTFEEYDAFCTATKKEKPDDRGWGRGNRPVINVSWLDAVAYCNWLSEQHHLTKVYTINGDQVTADWKADGYRLPTEAEWEYAARGGNKSKGYKYAGSNDLDEVAWYSGNSGRTTHPVGQKKPNELGLYDMSGNVWEWCQDWYDNDYYKNSPKENPKGPASGTYRVLRGGSWNYGAVCCQSFYRDFDIPVYKYIDYGFRLAKSLFYN